MLQKTWEMDGEVDFTKNKFRVQVECKKSVVGVTTAEVTNTSNCKILCYKLTSITVMLCVLTRYMCKKKTTRLLQRQVNHFKKHLLHMSLPN